MEEEEVDDARGGLAKLLPGDFGQGLVEYALLLALVTAATVVALAGTGVALGDRLRTDIETITTVFNSA